VSAPGTLGVVTGLLAEASLLAYPAVRTRTSGARPGAAAACARTLSDEGVAALASFGMAGGLAPALEAGDLLLPRRVLGPDGAVFPTDDAWRLRLAALAGAHADGALAGSAEAVTGPAAKSALHRATGAVAVDMESHEVAMIAKERGLPFLVVRAVADPWNRTIPSAALVGIGPDGARRPAAVMAALARRPWQVAGLLALARDAGAATKTLRRVARLGPLAFGV
jgi:adenosylhomocysteine nucleosidase